MVIHKEPADHSDVQPTVESSKKATATQKLKSQPDLEENRNETSALLAKQELVKTAKRAQNLQDQILEDAEAEPESEELEIIDQTIYRVFQNGNYSM